MHKNTKCILIKNTLSDSFQTGSRLKEILQFFHIKSRLSCLAKRLFFAIFAIHLHNSYFSMSHKIKITFLFLTTPQLNDIIVRFLIFLLRKDDLVLSSL